MIITITITITMMVIIMMMIMVITMNFIIVFVVHAGGGGPQDRRLAAGCQHSHPCLFNSVMCDFDTQSHLSMQVEVTMIIKMITVEIIVMNVIVLPAGGGGL